MTTLQSKIDSKQVGSRKSRKLLKNLSFCLGATLLLSACSAGGLGLGSAPRIFDLHAPADIEVGNSRTSRQLLVAEPSTVRFYATDRIVVRDSAATLAYFPDALWSDALPDLLQARFVEALEQTGRARAVGRPGQGLLIDTRLVPEIRGFEVEVSQAGAAVAVVDITLKVMNDANGRILATQRFETRVAAADDGAQSGVEALNIALDDVLRAMVVFVLDTV